MNMLAQFATDCLRLAQQSPGKRTFFPYKDYIMVPQVQKTAKPISAATKLTLQYRIR